MDITDRRAVVTWDQPPHPDGITVRNSLVLTSDMATSRVTTAHVIAFDNEIKKRTTLKGLRALSRYGVWIAAVNVENTTVPDVQFSNSDIKEFVTLGPSKFNGLPSYLLYRDSFQI